MPSLFVISQETQAYVLNFHGRVTQASVKNFQLVHSADGIIVTVTLKLYCTVCIIYMYVHVHVHWEFTGVLHVHIHVRTHVCM